MERKIILVVDDDTRMLTVIKNLLEDSYKVIAVSNGKLALKYLLLNSADLVLLDYMMPEEDGPTVLKHIRAGFKNSDIPVIFLTGVAERDLVIRGLELRPNGYLLKPVTKKALMDRINEVLHE